MKRIHVVAGIIWNQERNKILISKRPEHLHKGGYWEFPGGKVEADEQPQQALARELHEELDIRFDASDLFQTINHDYPEKHVRLDFYHVYDVVGEASSVEGQEIAWVDLHTLKDYTFPEANEPVVTALLAQY